jgi:hypothetical protein
MGMDPGILGPTLYQLSYHVNWGEHMLMKSKF